MQRLVFLAGRVTALLEQAAGLVQFSFSAFYHKIGSSLVVEVRQKWTFCGNVALSDGFFFGFAQQNPDVFLGGMGFRARQ